MTVLALILLLGGWILMYSGIRNTSITDELRAVFAG